MDFGGLYETSIFNDDLINEKGDILAEGNKVVIEAEASTNAETGTRLQIKDIYDIDAFFAKYKVREDVKLGVNKKKKYSNANDYSNVKEDLKNDNVNFQKNIVQQKSSNINFQTSNLVNQNIKIENQKENKYKTAHNSASFYTIKPVLKNKIISSKTYKGVETSIIEPQNAIKIRINNIEELIKVKNDLQQNKYGDKKIILEINNSEIVLN